jgi:aryl-alcohol dehydrogenase-like predicted oxidoreductase
VRHSGTADRSVFIEARVATARRALDAGLNVIDTAPNYEDGYFEKVVGRAVRDRATCQTFCC